MKISAELLTATTDFLFGSNVKLPARFISELKDLINSDLNHLQCCVIWERDEKFMSLVKKFNLPDIDLKEVIIASEEQGRACTNYRTAQFRELVA